MITMMTTKDDGKGYEQKAQRSIKNNSRVQDKNQDQDSSMKRRLNQYKY